MASNRGLNKASEYNNVIAGFLLNYRLDEEQFVYFLDIKDFNKMKESIDKK